MKTKRNTSQRVTMTGLFAVIAIIGPIAASGAMTILTPEAAAAVFARASTPVPHASPSASVPQTAIGDDTVNIDFSRLANGSVVTNQNPFATFSSTSGNVNYVSDQSSYDTPSFICTGPAGGSIDCTADTIVKFTSPVSDLKFDAVGVNNTGQVAEVDVYAASGLLAAIPITGDAGVFNAQLVDLSAYKDVTRIDITDITDGGGIGWTNFSFKPTYELGVDTNVKYWDFADEIDVWLQTPHVWFELINNDASSASGRDRVLGFVPTKHSLSAVTSNIRDDSGEAWTWRIRYPLTAAQFSAASGVVKAEQQRETSKNPPKDYKVTSTNCMWFAAKVAAAGGQTVPDYLYHGIPDPGTLRNTLEASGDGSTLDRGTVSKSP